MEFVFGNYGASIYHAIQAQYIRSIEGELLRAVGSAKGVVEQNWCSIQNELPTLQDDAVTGPQNLSSLCLETQQNLNNSNEVLTLVVYEQQREDKRIVGVILQIRPETADAHFQNLFVTILLSEMHLQGTIDDKLTIPFDTQQTNVELIVDLFDSYLRYSGPQDQWNVSGRRYFEDRVRYFVSRNAPLEFCLPAFPCKSSNPDKVAPGGMMMPDKGEQLALQRLHDFVREIEAVYKPGAKVWIISDGHVFSDCIGVEDELVDKYSASLIKMNTSLSKQGEPVRVAFKSLVDLFSLEGSGRQLTAEYGSEIPEINHFLDTRVTNEAESSRRILMTGCQSDREVLRGRIDSGDPSILALYRGFSKFMLEDLEFHTFTKEMSKSQRKKLAIKVSFEMIMRNQAYSNLVELLFPDHIRLSIHAHTNSGPKFGVQLFPKGLCKAIGNLSQCSPSEACSDLLHIPTPWHNCVIEVEGDPNIYIAKSKIVKEALKSGKFKGGWIEGTAGKAGHYKVSESEEEDIVTTKPLPSSCGSGLQATGRGALYSLGFFLVCCYVVSYRGFISRPRDLSVGN